MRKLLAFLGKIPVRSEIIPACKTIRQFLQFTYLGYEFIAEFQKIYIVL